MDTSTPDPTPSDDMMVDIPNPQVPNAARIYNYTLGGPYYTPADQGAAEYMFTLIPSTKKWVRLLRDCVQASARKLSEEGFTTFIDLAAGIPDQDHIHNILPRETKIIYTDIDEFTLAQAQKMVAHLPNVRYMRSDINDAKAFLNSPEVEEFLQGERRVAFGLNGISVFMAPDEMRTLFEDLYEWAAPGSKLYVTYETKAGDKSTPEIEQFVDMFRQAGSPFYFYTVDECLDLSAPWALTDEGLVPAATFLGRPEGFITEADHERIGLEFYAAILEKPMDYGTPM